MSSRSSISTEEFVPGRKLLVHIAENGHSYEFECDGSTPVEAIQRSIESLCGVHIGDQLLLCRNTSLDSQNTLAHYKLPQDDSEVFVYNKSRLLADSPLPPSETIDIPNAAVPAPPSPSQSPHPLDDASDPALKALGSYERQFRFHFQFANVIYGSTRSKFEVCKRLLREMQVQERALETAQGNLGHTFRKLQQRYTDFIKCFNQQHRYHSELLKNFERDVERLRSVKLHPLLQNDSRKCLLDLVKENDLRKWADNCFNSHKQFEVKVSQLKQNFGELSRRVDGVFHDMDSTGIKELELMMKDHQIFLNDQKSILQSLSKDVGTVKRLVDDCINYQSSKPLRPHDAISGLGSMYEVHEKNHLPNVQNCDHTIAKLLANSTAKKNETNMAVHFCMQKVKSSQLSIKDTMNELHAFQEVMGHKEKEFDDLMLVNGISHAYRACLAEVVRRKSYSKLYMGLAGQCAEKLAADRETEIRRREGFCKAWSKYIPHDILASLGLFDSPSQCNVSIYPFDTNLVNIDVGDIDRYAPPALIGVQPRFETSKSGRSDGVASADNSNLTTSEENAVASCEKVDFHGLIEGCLPVDISGTSRLEVENAQLKADLASAIAIICSSNAGTRYETFDEAESENLLKTIKDKTAEALHSKDEYIRHIQSLLNMKQVQCSTYEKRIHELEQRLVDRYNAGQNISTNKKASESFISELKIDGYRGDIFGDEEAPPIAFVSTVTMEEASCTSASVDLRLDLISMQPGKLGEGGDENMVDLLGMVTTSSLDPSHKVIDASMLEPSHDDHEAGDDDEESVVRAEKDKVGETETGSSEEAQQMRLTSNSSDVGTRLCGIFSCGIAANPSLESKIIDNVVLDLQSTVAERSRQFDMSENKVKAALEEICSLKRELEIRRNLLDESQMNCAHLENCLHEAREEARTNLCAAERRASEYNALRATAVKMHGLFERFRNCVTALDGSVNFSDSLRSFALSLGSGSADDEDDVSANFRACIIVIADKVSVLNRRIEQLSKQMEDQRELIKTLYRKHQLEKQASKEKISFLRMEVHELAAFVLNPAGNYEAMNRNCPNYFLSSESVALFTEHSSRPAYIIGQIVHIEKQIARPQPSSSQASQDEEGETICSSKSGKNTCNPYGLAVGSEYFIVTVAMLPDTIHSTTIATTTATS
ncbi:autophagy-related protein 11 [Phalaenopsis equestris]|uniref:autophagy-related protein 11 n=1 Tax=Phalaenopsis equestris TaxID=78828 RepID=UPI0009E5BFDA|nr:autophagy-related protein 11 [Phalaenopsis equestris]XP_020577730.1 autophagy-related protein 11 [Phalaenopsis equestris]XP_020577738.1 autophagy-related protein 11 [Phalaenopsis equestris]